MKIKKHILWLWVLLLLTDSLFSLTIKIGSIAPARSPWDNAIKKMGREWARISGGKVEIKVYAGGITGDEADMIRKMRMGLLGGAALTNLGITHIYADTFVLSTPMLITSDGELNYIFEKMKPYFEKEIEKKGFKVIIWSLTGWVNFFTKGKVLYPEDLRKHKISFATGMPQMEQAFKKAGYYVIPNDLNDLMMALQSGMVDACYMPPLLAASGQYFAQVPNMCSLKVAPLLGGIVLSTKIWEQIPDEYRKEMIAVLKKISDDLYQEVSKLEKDAIEKMKEHDLVVNEAPADSLIKWKAAAEKGMDELIGKAYSKEVYDQVMSYLKEYHKSHGN